MSLAELLEGLNTEQREAVTTEPGPTLVVAGPGSGKTSVLTRRVAYLIDQLGVAPFRIMAVTFTNKAAREMQNRIGRLVGEPQGLTIGTFHAICARILRREISALGGYTSDYTIYDTDDQLAVIRTAMADLDIDHKRTPPYSQLNRISAAKNELIGPGDFIPNIPPEKVTQRIYTRYQEVLRQNNALDFDDLIMLPVVLFQQHPDVLARIQSRYEHILVDEFQDTNTAQYQLVRLLAGPHGNLFVVGDPDQSIYRFRGAIPHNVTQFRHDYDPVKLIRLGQNYRSHQLILDAATAVIRRNSDHIPITLTGQRSDGPKIVLREWLTEEQEARYIVDQIAEYVQQGYHPRDCAVMYRVNAQSRSLEEAFVRAGLPYKLIGATRFYSRKEIKDALAYLRLIYNPDDSVSLRRVINLPPRGLGDKTLDQLDRWAALRGESVSRALQALADGEVGPFTARAQKSLIEFATLLDGWIQAKATISAAALLDDVLARTHYAEFLNDGSDDAQDRLENLNALRGVAHEHGAQPLGEFLEDVSLVADADTRDDHADAPTLLTLHAAKGLEYAVVFITGLEDGTLPHQRSLDDDEQMAEERRLLYVGITRAKEILQLSWVARRMMYGGGDYLPPSRFLSDLPRELTAGSPIPTRATRQGDWRAYREMTTWDSAAFGARRQAPAANDKTPKPNYRSGQRVNHDKFGEGIVITSAIRGGVEEIEVRFMDKRYGFKKLLAEHVKPG
ncbi:MAG: ATP-dependent helicase [Aggregatilineales bacterium]